MKRYWKGIRTLLPPLLCLALASCGGPAPGPPGEGGPPDARDAAYYEGLIQEYNPTQPQKETLYDIFTGEPQCVTEHAKEDTELDAPGGGPYANTFSALYNLEGNLLYEKAEVTYLAGFGDYIIRRYVPSDKGGFTPEFDPANMVGVKSSLWNYKTGEEVLADAAQLIKLDEGAAIVEDPFGQVMGVIDPEAKPIGGFPPAQSYIWADVLDSESGYFSAKIGDSMNPWGEEGKTYPIVLLDRELKALMTGPGYLQRAGAPGYAIYGDGGRQNALSLPDARILFSLEEDSYFQYYDGELAIEYRSEEAYPYRLLSAEGKPLTDWYEEVRPFGENGKQPAGSFLLLRDGRLEKWGRDLKVLNTAAIPIRTFSLSGSILTYTGQSDIPCYGYDCPVGLLSPELEVLVPDEKYRAISPLYDWEKGDYTPTGFLTATHAVENSYISDLMDERGNVLAEKLNDIRWAAPGLFQVEKGFEVGVMDDKGSWLYRRSRFTGFEND